MTVSREVVRHVDYFDRAQSFTSTPAGEFGWTIADTSAAGTPTYLCLTDDGGAAKLLLAADSEAENVCLFQNDVLPYDLALLQYVEFIAKVAGINSVTQVVLGVGSARNDTPDSVTVNAWFKIAGTDSTSAIVLETDDNVVDNDDKASGGTLAAVYKRLLIDFSNGLADVRFFIDGARAGQATTFNMSAVTAGQNVQLIAQVQKASGTGVPAVTLTKVTVQFKTADGA